MADELTPQERALLPAAEQRRLLNPPPPTPADPTRRQSAVVGNMGYDWIPSRGWVSTGPTSRLLRSFPERSREIFGVGATAPTATAVGAAGSRGSGRDFYRGGGIPVAAAAAAERAAAESIVEEPAAAAPAGVPSIDMSSVLALLPFEQTEAERAALEQSLADLESRAEAGMQALGTAWGEVQRRNQAAADKARSMVAQVGARAGALWVQMAQAALEKAGVIAGVFGAPAGRQAINIDPTAGAANYAAMMGSLAPAYEAAAASSQERLADDLSFLSGMASQQGVAYQGELQRTYLIQAAQTAREHNAKVAERANQNRRTAAELLAQAQRTQATLAASGAKAEEEGPTPLEQLVEQSALQRAAAEALAGRPDAARQLADIMDVPLATAQALVADVLANR